MMTVSPDLQAFLADPTHAWLKDITNKDLRYESVLHQHYAEREYRGFSRYDWWNFSQHLLWLIKQSCEALVDGRVPAKNDTVRYAGDVLRLLQSANELLNDTEDDKAFSDTLMSADADDNYSITRLLESLNNPSAVDTEYMSRLLEAERHADAEKSEAVTIFFDKIFIKLPYNNSGSEYVPVNFGTPGRALTGMNSDDLTQLRSYLSSVIINGLNLFMSTHAHGFAGTTVEEWNTRLKSITTALEHLQIAGRLKAGSDELKHYQQGMNTLKEVFPTLWD